jgi:hypothetical protein
MEIIYGIFDDNQTIQCLFKTEKGAEDHCKHMNKDSKCEEIGLPEEFYVDKVTLYE